MYLFLLTLWRTILLVAHALAAPFNRGRELTGGLVVILGLPFFLAWLVIQWLGLLLDEILFRGYRRVEIREPLFVIGPPRTGTTHLHHVLAADPGTTTFRTWECLFGLSVTTRYIGLGMSRLHRAVGAPFQKLGNWLGSTLFKRMEDIHPIRLDEPEEDFLALLPVLACFLIVIPLPTARWLWSVSRFDTDLGRREQQALLCYYRRAIQKHLYVFGRDRRFLSKNASFAGMVGGLLAEFPDARIIATVRDPIAVVPSQLSSLRPALELCGFASIPVRLRDDLIALLAYYYVNLKTKAAKYPGRIAFIDNSELRYELEDSIRRAFGEIAAEPSSELLDAVRNLPDGPGAKVSRHKYTLEEFDLSEATVRSRLAAVYTSYVFGGAAPAAEQETE